MKKNRQEDRETLHAAFKIVNVSSLPYRCIYQAIPTTKERTEASYERDQPLLHRDVYKISFSVRTIVSTYRELFHLARKEKWKRHRQPDVRSRTGNRKYTFRRAESLFPFLVPGRNRARRSKIGKRKGNYPLRWVRE